MPRSICFVGHLMLPLLRGTNEPVVGGAEVQMFHLAQELVHRGWDASFLVCGLAPTDRGWIDTPLGPAQVLYPRRARKTGAQKLHEKRALYAAVRATGAGLVFQRAVWDADVAALAARARRVPYVYSLASDRDAVQLPRWSRRRNVIRWATRVVVQSSLQQDWLRRYGRQSTPIASGFPVPPTPAAAPAEVLWVGTLRALKRPELFLDLAAAFPAHPFVLCGGPGEDPELARHIERRAATLPNVRFEGFVPYARMAAHYARARVLVNTSTYEGFPNTFVLAWLHGAMVVSMGVDPDGWLTRGGLGAVGRDATELRRLVGRALEDPAWATTTGARARAHAVQQHDIRHVATAFESVFESAQHTAP